MPNEPTRLQPDVGDKVDLQVDIDESSPRKESDIAVRKKKNADAQAAFRQRRTNYIATLEETVTSLESVVLVLQDSCREASNEVDELRQDNARLKHELHKLEKSWRAAWKARKTGQVVPKTDDIPSLPSTSPAQPQSNVTGKRLHASRPSQYNADSVGYQTSGAPTPIYTPAPSHAYLGHSPSLSYPGVDNEHTSSGSSCQMGSSRPSSKSGQYAYPVQTINCDGTWNHSMYQSSSSSGSPTLTSPEKNYVNYSFVDEQKVPLSCMETTPCVSVGSRSISRSTSTPSSSTTASLTSLFQSAFSPLRTQESHRTARSSTIADTPPHTMPK